MVGAGFAFATHGGAVVPQLVAAALQEPHIPIPEQYSGVVGSRTSLLLQCSLVFYLQPLANPSDREKITLLINLLSGRATLWATAILENQTPVSSSFPAFTGELKRFFDHPVQSSEAASQILSQRQGASSVANYSICFRILAARSEWNDAALQGVFPHGLADNLKDELAAREEPENMEALISLATRLDNTGEVSAEDKRAGGILRKSEAPLISCCSCSSP